MSDLSYKAIRKIGMPVIDGLYHPSGINSDVILHNEPLIVCSNHYHYCDQYVIEKIMYDAWKKNAKKEGVPPRIIHWFAKNEYSKGIKSNFYRAANCIFVKRGSDEARECLIEGIDALNKGHSVGIFPEGTRNTYFFAKYELEKALEKFEELSSHRNINANELETTLNLIKELRSRVELCRKDLEAKPKNARIIEDEPILGFHLGAAQMSKETGVKMLPVAVTGNYDKDSNNVLVNFGEPVDSFNMSTSEATEEIRGKILKLVNENRKMTHWKI